MMKTIRAGFAQRMRDRFENRYRGGFDRFKPHGKTATRPMLFEALEQRTLLSVSWATFDNGVLTIDGTAGDDVIRYDVRATPFLSEITRNGEVFTIEHTTVTKAVINAGEGMDELQFVGDRTRTEVATMNRDGTASMTSNGQTVLEVTGAENQRFYGYGADVVTMTDTAGDDRFVSFDGGSSLTDVSTGQFSYAEGFSFVTAEASHGGADIAELYDYHGVTAARLGDQYAQVALVNVANGYREATGFDRNYIYAVNQVAGSSVEFSASWHVEQYRSFENFTDVHAADGSYRYASGFEQVNIVNNNANPEDLVEFYDTPGDDIAQLFRTAEGLNTMTIGEGLATPRRATGFVRMNTYSVFGGDDSLFFGDFATNAHAVSFVDSTSYTGQGFAGYGSGYSTVSVQNQSNFDTYTTVDIYDSPGDDTFSAEGPNKYFVNSATSTRSFLRFDRYNAFAVNGGYDSVNIENSTSNDVVMSFGTWTQMNHGTNNVIQYVAGFESVTVTSRYAYSTDRVDIYDTTDDDVLTSDLDRTVITGNGTTRTFEEFEHTNVFAINGGSDTATVNDTVFEDRVRLFNQVVDVSSLSTDPFLISPYRYFRGFEILNVVNVFDDDADDDLDVIDIFGQDADSGDVGGLTYQPASQPVYQLIGFD